MKNKYDEKKNTKKCLTNLTLFCNPFKQRLVFIVMKERSEKPKSNNDGLRCCPHFFNN